MKLTANIRIQELVPKDIYLKYGDKAVQFIDARLPKILERIRELCGNKQMILNDWYYGGRYNLRGYRSEDCTVGAVHSQHKKGKAADFDIKGLTAKQVRLIIRMNATELMSMGLTRIETGISWVHIDLKETGLNQIVEFKP